MTSGRLKKSAYRTESDGTIIIGCEIPYVEKMQICEAQTVDGIIVYGYHFKRGGKDYVVDKDYIEHEVINFSYKLR